MAVWHHQCNGHELGQTLGDGEGQGGLVCCSPWGGKESDMTGQLKNNRYLPNVCYCSVAQSCLTLWDPMDCSTPGLPVPHHLLEFAQVHVHCIVMPSSHLILS